VVSCPADGVSAADVSGSGVADGPGATQQMRCYFRRPI